MGEKFYTQKRAQWYTENYRSSIWNDRNFRGKDAGGIAATAATTGVLLITYSPSIGG
jgi:hypothetical protein